jgi:hypothetical protein
MTEEHDIVEQRLSRVEAVLRTIERSRRRWRNCTIAIVALVLAYGVLGAKEKPADAEFGTVTARELRVVKADGSPIFTVLCDEGLSTLMLSSPRTGAFVSLAATPDTASVATNTGDRLHRIEMISSKAINRLHLQTKTVDTGLLDASGDAGSIELTKTADGKHREMQWSAPPKDQGQF